MPDLAPILLEPHGPADTGLTAWEPIDPAGLTAGEPVQRGHNYYDDPTGQLAVGVWDCTPMTTVLEPYSVNEFMHLLEGAVTIVDDGGHAQTFVAGESFVIPKGTPCVWKQEGYVRKFYVIFDDRSGAAPADPDWLRAIRIEADAALPALEQQDTSRYVRGVPDQHLLEMYADVTGQFHAGLWDTSEMHTRAQPLARSELMHLLAGEVTITNGDGRRFPFRAGQTFLVPKGMSYQWDSTGYVRKVFCSFQPQA